MQRIYPDNMIAALHRVGSRYATLACGILLILLGSRIKFDMLVLESRHPCSRQ
jgi:hypothetical protein